MCNQGVKFTNGTTKFVLKPKKNITELQPLSMTFSWLLKDILASRIVMHNMKNELFTMRYYI